MQEKYEGYCAERFICMNVDYAAKKMFHKEKILKAILSVILNLPEDDIKSVTYLDTNTIRDNKVDKLSILDVYVELNNNVKINIEIQTVVYKNWENRTMVNLFKKWMEPLNAGAQYTDEHLPRCIHISILSFICRPQEPDFHNKYQLLNSQTGNLYSDRIQFHLLELPKLQDAREEEKQTKLYKWCRLFAAQSWDEYEEIARGDEMMEAAVDVMKEISMSETEWLEYWNQKLAIMDDVTQKHIARQEGIAIGEERGEKRGERRYAELARRMILDQRSEELLKAADSDKVLQSLYKEYGIE